MQHNIYKRADYNRFFFNKYKRLFGAMLNKNEKRPDYTNKEVINEIILPFENFAKKPQPEQRPPIPKNIWMLWQQGWDKAPNIVQACAKSWQEKNKGWKIHLLDESNIKDFAPKYSQIYAPKASRTARANIARLSLLNEHGGVWADATLFCQQPLDDWIYKAMGKGIFMFSDPRPYRLSEIWFIASDKRTYLTDKWLEIVENYWRCFKYPHHYYWMEYLFEMLVNNDEEIRKTWQNVPKLSANGPHIIQSTPFETDVNKFNISTKRQEILPVHKLSHKFRFKGSLKNTPIGLLTGLEYLKKDMK